MTSTSWQGLFWGESVRGFLICFTKNSLSLKLTKLAENLINFLCGSNRFVFLSQIFVLFEPYIRFHFFSSVRVTEWLPIGE